MWCTFDLSSVQGHFEVIRYICVKMACKSKAAGHRTKRAYILKSRRLVKHMWGIFDLVVFKVILGSFGVLASKWPVLKKVAHRVKQIEIWDPGAPVQHIWSTSSVTFSLHLLGYCLEFFSGLATVTKGTKFSLATAKDFSYNMLGLVRNQKY